MYSRYNSVFLYSASSALYLSFAVVARVSNGCFSTGARFCHLSPTSFAMSVKDMFCPRTSSRILLENRTYALGGLEGPFSSGLGWRLYFRFVPLPPCVPRSGTSVGEEGLPVALPMSLTVSKAGEPMKWSYGVLRWLAISRWSF